MYLFADYLNLDLFDCFLIIRFRLNALGNNPTLVILDSSQHVISRRHMMLVCFISGDQVLFYILSVFNFKTTYAVAIAFMSYRFQDFVHKDTEIKYLV